MAKTTVRVSLLLCLMTITFSPDGVLSECSADCGIGFELNRDTLGNVVSAQCCMVQECPEVPVEEPAADAPAPAPAPAPPREEEEKQMAGNVESGTADDTVAPEGTAEVGGAESSDGGTFSAVLGKASEPVSSDPLVDGGLSSFFRTKRSLHNPEPCLIYTADPDAKTIRIVGTDGSVSTLINTRGASVEYRMLAINHYREKQALYVIVSYSPSLSSVYYALAAIQLDSSGQKAVSGVEVIAHIKGPSYALYASHNLGQVFVAVAGVGIYSFQLGIKNPEAKFLLDNYRLNVYGMQVDEEIGLMYVSCYYTDAIYSLNLKLESPVLEKVIRVPDMGATGMVLDKERKVLFFTSYIGAPTCGLTLDGSKQVFRVAEAWSDEMTFGLAVCNGKLYPSVYGGEGVSRISSCGKHDKFVKWDAFNKGQSITA